MKLDSLLVKQDFPLSWKLPRELLHLEYLFRIIIGEITQLMKHQAGHNTRHTQRIFIASGVDMTAELNRNINMTFGPEPRFIGMRCYFNLINGIDKITDPDGIKVLDIEHALAQAMKAIEELREEDHAAPSDWADWSLEVTDFFGVVLFSIDLGEVLH